MNRQGLHRIIRAVTKMLGEDTVVIIGSQPILASFREFMLPDDATMSAEVDVLPFDDNDEVKADKVDGLLGEASYFSEKYGIYADGVSPWTASLPSGWEQRVATIHDSHRRTRTSLQRKSSSSGLTVNVFGTDTSTTERSLGSARSVVIVAEAGIEPACPG